MTDYEWQHVNDSGIEPVEEQELFNCVKNAQPENVIEVEIIFTR